MQVTAARSSSSAPQDRAGLKQLLDDYLSALIARDPSSLPVARDLRFTENGGVLRLGEGLWKGASRVRPETRLDFIDVAAGQAGSQLVIEENGSSPVICQFRIRLVGGAIAEVESIAVRNGDLKFFEPDGMKPVPIFYEAVPPARRMTRERMIDTVERYVELLKVGSYTQSRTRIHKHMVRWENGAVTSDYARLSTRENGPQRAAIPTRFPIVDEEYGLVYALMEFGLADKTLCPFELFKIMDDEIVMLHIVIKSMPTRSWG
jgi:hypothetical protein